MAGAAVAPLVLPALEGAAWTLGAPALDGAAVDGADVAGATCLVLAFPADRPRIFEASPGKVLADVDRPVH